MENILDVLVDEGALSDVAHEYMKVADANADGSLNDREFETLLLEFMNEHDLKPLEFSDSVTKSKKELIKRMGLVFDEVTAGGSKISKH